MVFATISSIESVFGAEQNCGIHEEPTKVAKSVGSYKSCGHTFILITHGSAILQIDGTVQFCPVYPLFVVGT